MFERTKAHFKRNKKLYVGIGIGAGVAGITLISMRKNSLLDVPRVSTTDVPRASGKPDMASARTFSFALFMKNSGNATATLHTGTKGHPGFLTRCLETGELFTSQNKAAETLGVSASLLSSHLNGKMDNVDGLHFERVLVS